MSKPRIIRKRRPILAVLDRLTDQQKQRLMSWLTTGGPHGIGVSYAAAVKLVDSEFGLKVSPSTMYTFFLHYHRDAAPKAEVNERGRILIIKITLPK